jgi:hypothetical protein
MVVKENVNLDEIRSAIDAEVKTVGYVEEEDDDYVRTAETKITLEKRKETQ